LAADLATKMGSDLPNATRMLTNALTDPVAGLNQLIRQGNIDFPAATVTMIENMAKAGDTAGADAVILQTLQNSIGGVAQAAAGAPGAALTQLSNQLTALGTVIGNDLLPLLDAVARDLEPVIQDVSNWAEAHPKLTDAIVLGTAALTGLLLVIGLIGVAIITVTPVVEAIGVVIAALSGPVGIAILIIAALTALIISNWTLIQSVTETIWNGIYTYFVGGWELEKNLFASALDDISHIWESAWTDMSAFLGNIWSTIQNTVKTGVDYVISAINGFINALDAIRISIPSISIPGTKLATPAINLGFSIPDIPMLAAGGFVTQPTLAIIGEAGPEAVVPLSQMGAAGAGGQQIVINVNGGLFLNPQTVKQLADYIAKSINTQVRVTNYRT
jgi:phage-related minor tail protein